ncbi:hypothetical protein PoB_002723700 [Plakobranchus ocellatus]|uniref:Uncharacterized protein n=1 Tax=Plakobranchus ocellatus TaxID=259542 RepID=A0AAV4A1I2_9GAST|nr:hypothetical protein PoB_002723700 [Plakobranchus ocellatus]
MTANYSLGTVRALVSLTVTGMSKNVAIAPSFLDNTTSCLYARLLRLIEGHEEGTRGDYFKVMRNLFGSRAPHPTWSTTKRTNCREFQCCASARLELYSQLRVWDLYWD